MPHLAPSEEISASKLESKAVLGPRTLLSPSDYPSRASWCPYPHLLAPFPRRNVIHGSDSVASARREIALWFSPKELLCWEDSTEHWLYE